MIVNGKSYKTVWMEGRTVCMIDQNKLPFHFDIFRSETHAESAASIRNMTVRGAGAIGAVAGFAMAQAFMEAPEKNRDLFLADAKKLIESSRPTARNLFHATERVFEAGMRSTAAALEESLTIAKESDEDGKKIGEHGYPVVCKAKRILTHCNAGWLGFVDYGSALSPVYHSFARGNEHFVFADETRPRSQGARLTAWELFHAKIPFAIIPDNAAAYYMQRGDIDLVITGADRIALNGDVANKIGTLEKAILAKEFGIPFYVAAPTSTFDKNCLSGSDIPIEERDEQEVLYQTGPDEDGIIRKVRVAAPGAKALNPAFDVTPAKYITGIITEKGIVQANTEAIIKLLHDG